MKIVSTLKSEREELNVKINKNNLVEAHERVQNFREIYEAFHNSINNRAPTPEKLKIVIEHDFQHKSEQYLKDLEFSKNTTLRQNLKDFSVGSLLRSLKLRMF